MEIICLKIQKIKKNLKKLHLIMKEKASLFNHDEWSENWYARGIGYVRHDKLDDDMQPKETEILIRIDQK